MKINCALLLLKFMLVVSIEACSVKDVALANLAKALAAEKVCRGNGCRPDSAFISLRSAFCNYVCLSVCVCVCVCLSVSVSVSVSV
jgi:hypothetical protein